MKVTNLQLTSLKLLLQQRSRPLTTMDFFKQSWRKYLFILLLLLGAITTCALSGLTPMALLLGGYLVGVIERDAQWIRNEMEVMPLTSEITNWERVEQLIKENEHPNA